MDEDSLREAVAIDSEILRYVTEGTSLSGRVSHPPRVQHWVIELDGISKTKCRKSNKADCGHIMETFLFLKARGIAIWSEKIVTHSRQRMNIITFYRSSVEEFYFLDNLV